MLKTKVKVSKVTNLSEARYCAGMGVDMLGFPVGPGHDGIDPQKYKEITGWVAGPDFVLEWTGSEIPDNLADLLSPYNANLVEIDARHVKNVPFFEIPMIVVLAVREWGFFQSDLKAKKDRIAYVLVTGLKESHVDASLIGEIGREFPVLLAYGISKNNLDALDTLTIAGISLQGGEESSPGLKDYTALSEILEGLEVV